MIDNQSVRDDRIDRPRGSGDLRLPHAIANDLTAPEFDLFAIGGEVGFNLDDQVCIRQPDTVPGCRAEHVRIGGAGDFGGHGVCS